MTPRTKADYIEKVARQFECYKHPNEMAHRPKRRYWRYINIKRGTARFLTQEQLHFHIWRP